ncbi:MAG: tRNA(Ile)(2)-agmatinylcytidine synthase [Sulfolobales archaeon]|nr:tRNA(Ile)(2)-agmatinylcytidine synthase [Sulfolobales archaeon]MCX8198497.1 tRNA(Ile)(2)-agmatinylcytidine synthase [Sulfolobales archaeon]MDW8169572.1 tRNA(Ile)(2)-agmatinylcytidine synthase [Desulfurococcaceae archaeon]
MANLKLNGVELHVGFDDVDSPRGGCTTDLVSEIAIKWSKRGVKFIDYPNLVRLNPAIPWKTRGNGALSLRVLAESYELAKDMCSEAISISEDYVAEFTHLKRSPHVVCFIGHVPGELESMGEKAVRDVVLIDEALSIVEKHLPKVITWSNSSNRRGLIGALAAVGNRLTKDHTYELIAYRSRDYWGTPRLIDPVSVFKMDEETGGLTFLNVDKEANRILIAPHGPDPILFGIRGEEPSALIKALSIVKTGEPIAKWIIFRTNQATDEHLKRVRNLCEAYAYTGVIAVGRVSRDPRIIAGGHVILTIADECGEVDAAAYEPTEDFRGIVKELKPGDVVEVYGVVRPPSSIHGKTINLEKIRVIKLAEVLRQLNPICPKCGRRMTSSGKGKGFKCTYCGYRDPTASKVVVIEKRRVAEGWYQPPPRAFKHLMKPLERFGREKSGWSGVMIEKWHS